MESKQHPWDTEINRQEEPNGLLPTFHYAQTQDLPYTLAVDSHTRKCFISSALIAILNLRIRIHPAPYVIEGGYHIDLQGRLSFKIESYEDALWCDIVTIKSVSVILGRAWIINKQIRYNKRRTTLIYPWMKKAAPQPAPPSQPVPELAVQLITETEHVVEPEPIATSLPEP